MPFRRAILQHMNQFITNSKKSSIHTHCTTCIILRETILRKHTWVLYGWYRRSGRAQRELGWCETCDAVGSVPNQISASGPRAYELSRASTLSVSLSLARSAVSCVWGCGSVGGCPPLRRRSTDDIAVGQNNQAQVEDVLGRKAKR